MTTPLRLFEGIGIELEYMIVAREGLDVFPCCDKLMSQVVGSPESEYEDGDIAWSNELALHVVEIKTNGPAAGLKGLEEKFQDATGKISTLLEPLGGMLLPTAMHPWMNPGEETKLWPHEYTDIYRAYDRIFDCRGHGWSNVQSTHINLPFNGDDEFSRLHAAIRLVLPLLPALAASSPVVEGNITGILDNRLEFYRHNQDRVPIIAGSIIPEPVYTEEAYREEIHVRVADAIRPLDPDGVLDPIFLNSRGAIARFDRGAIEIRLLDIQESPRADIAICALVVETIRALVAEQWSPLVAQQYKSTDELAEILTATTRFGHSTPITDQTFLHLFGLMGGEITAGALWGHLLKELSHRLGPWEETLRPIITQGPLAARIARALPTNPTRKDLEKTYRRLAACLQEGSLFLP